MLDGALIEGARSNQGDSCSDCSEREVYSDGKRNGDSCSDGSEGGYSVGGRSVGVCSEGDGERAVICSGEVYKASVGERSVETAWTVGSYDRVTRSVNVGKLGDGVREDRVRAVDTAGDREGERDETVSGEMDGRRDMGKQALGVASEDASSSM